MHAIQHKQDKIVRDQQSAEIPVSLINGVFDSSTARNMLTDLLEKQTQHFKLRNWKSQVNKECCDTPSVAQIEKLDDAKTLFSELCQEAKLLNKDLVIKSQVYIEFADRSA